MSSVAIPREAALGRAGRRVLSAALERLGADALLAVAILALLAVLLTQLPGDFNIDSWLALVTGREVWQSGVPHLEMLTALTHGARWIDQQWLSQLASYGLFLAGGFGLLGLVNVSLLTSGVAGATIGARRLGAPLLSVAAALPLCFALIVRSNEVRTQEFAIPLFAALAYLLARDARSPSHRVYWCLPILVLWANLHGSVTIGALLVVLRGVTLAWERRRLMRRSARAWLGPLALAIGAPVAILITPYGLGIIGYYRATLFDSALRRAVSEWQPITTVPVATAALLAVGAAALWALRRNPLRSTPWERLALLALAAGSISVVRNALFFGLLALMVVPVWLGLGERSAGARPAGTRVLVNGGLLGAALLTVLLAGAGALARPASAYAPHRLPLLAVVRGATRAEPALRVLADERYADWLLWRDPALAGRVAVDARFELLSAGQLGRLVNLVTATGAGWKQAAQGDRLLVLDRADEPAAVSGFLTEPGRRVLFDDGQSVVILRSTKAAGER